VTGNQGFFFVFWPFVKKIQEMNPARNLFARSGPFESRQCSWRGS
jgi:hypothetical protein